MTPPLPVKCLLELEIMSESLELVGRCSRPTASLLVKLAMLQLMFSDNCESRKTSTQLNLRIKDTLGQGVLSFIERFP